MSDAQQIISQSIKEHFPQADIAEGTVIGEFGVKLPAAANNAIADTIISEDAVATFSTVINSTVPTFFQSIDRIASNYNVYRNEGRKASGSVRLTLSTNRNYTLNIGSIIFVSPANNTAYVLSKDYFVGRVGDVTQDVLKMAPDGTFFVDLVVEGEDVGERYQLAQGATLALRNPTTLNNFVSASVLWGFSSGQDRESDQQLLQRLQEGLSNKGLLSQQSITANLSATFGELRDLSVVGANSSIFTRDKQYGVAVFGMADIYVRNSFGLESTTVDVVAEKISETEWQATLTAEQAAGVYRVHTVSDNQRIGTFDILNQIFSIAPPQTPTNNFFELSQVRFSKYQEVVIIFANADGSPVGELQTVGVTSFYQPRIADMQSYVLDSARRIVCADYMVRSVVPCRVTAKIVVRKKTNNTFVDEAAMRQDIFNHINSLSFGEPLTASSLINLCHQYDIAEVRLPIQLTGEIFCPSGQELTISSTNKLEIPTDNENFVSMDNTLFFVNNDVRSLELEFV